MPNSTRAFAIRRKDNIISPEDSGVVNGKVTFNPWIDDAAEIRTLYAPPVFSETFRLKLRFNGRTVHSPDNLWEPDQLTRCGRLDNWTFTSRTLPIAGTRGGIMVMEVRNRSSKCRSLEIQYEITATIGYQSHWGFGKPRGGDVVSCTMQDDILLLQNSCGTIAAGSSLEWSPLLPLCSGVMNGGSFNVKAGGQVKFHTFFALAPTGDEALKTVQKFRKAPEKCCADSRKAWQARTDKLFDRMPVFTSSNKAMEKLYNRSLLHLLLNEWDVPEFMLHPYYGTGSINGGCICCYLWNYGEPFRLWSMLDPVSAAEHLKTFLKLDLTGCFAFFPEDGSPNGPYYPVNQEKVLLLALACTTQTGDKEFLKEKVNGKTIISHLIDAALCHDDLSKKAVLADYGDGNHHLELRRELRYDGVVPDLNLRRCINFHLAAVLCRMAGVKAPADFEQRAEDLKKLVHKELFSKKDGWFKAIGPDGKKYLRWTMQMFKVLGWGDWALTPESSAALMSHLMDESEFLGRYGIHSLSRKDPAYDEWDVDNGGPGACISFAPAIAERLYADGRKKEGAEILRRLLWLGSSMPYWGDSQRADIPEYRRDTPLQCDIQGGGPAQLMIFGVFGIRVNEDLSVTISPALPGYADDMTLKNIRLAGRRFSIICGKNSFTVRHESGCISSSYGSSVTL